MLDAIFGEHAEWHARNFGRGDKNAQMLKLVEEVGELAAAMYRGNREDELDAVADVFITLMGYARAGGIHLPNTVEFVWRSVRERNYARHPKDGRTR